MYYYLLIAMAVIAFALLVDEGFSDHGPGFFYRSNEWHQRLVRLAFAVFVCLWIVSSFIGVHTPLFWEGMTGRWMFLNVIWNLLFNLVAVAVVCALLALVCVLGALVFVGLKKIWGWLWFGDIDYY